VKIDQAAIAGLLPHAGTMCLLDEVVSWTHTAIVCRTSSQRRPDHPLRSAGRLPALAAIEYAAQAMAVHHGLARQAGRPRLGYLARLREVVLHVARLDEIEGELLVSAEQLAAGSSQSKYDFQVRGQGRELAAGQALVVLVA